VPDGQSCLRGYCCNGPCVGGVCPAATHLFASEGERCRELLDCDTGLTCDAVSGACARMLCFGAARPAGSGLTGCCALGADARGACTFADGGSCRMPANTGCTAGDSTCCSGRCLHSPQGFDYCDVIPP
jgi:hypothetical protein